MKKRKKKLAKRNPIAKIVTHIPPQIVHSKKKQILDKLNKNQLKEDNDV